MDAISFEHLRVNGFFCSGCGVRHAEIFDIAFDFPQPSTAPTEVEPNSGLPSALRDGRDILCKDFCVQGADRFVRAILPLPLIGTDQQFALGVWGTFSPANFQLYVDHFDGGTAGAIAPALS